MADDAVLGEAERILEDRLAGLELAARIEKDVDELLRRRFDCLALAAEMVRQARAMPSLAEVQRHVDQHHRLRPTG